MVSWVMEMVALRLNLILEHGDDIVDVMYEDCIDNEKERCKFLPTQSP